jgi:thiamine biosynthesis lipoprotein ApbE
LVSTLIAGNCSLFKLAYFQTAQACFESPMPAVRHLATMKDEVTTMAKIITYQIDADEARQLEAAVNECIAEMQQANQRMENRQVEIDRLKAETRAMLSQIRQLRAA